MAHARANSGLNTYRVIAALVMVALGIGVTWSAWVDIWGIAYSDPEASHIYLVFPVAAWLIWVRRARLRHCRLSNSYLGCAIVALGLFCSSWGYWHSLHIFRHGGAVLVVVGAFVTVTGRQLLSRFLPAFLVLVFLIPVPGRVRMRISVPLMTATAKVSASVSEVLGVPLERSGNELSVAGHHLLIAEACNGLRMVFSLVLVSYAFAFGEPLRNYVRFLIVAASPLSSIVCNVIRLLPTLWLFGYGPQRIAAMFHDYVSGWVMLVVAFLSLMAIIRTLRWALIPVAPYTLAAEA
jgi:exosortase